jgi:hypothetical protein
MPVSLEQFEPMTAIPSTVKLTSYAGGVENLIKVHPD